VVEADRLEQLAADALLVGQQRAGEGMVDAEALALEHHGAATGRGA
jgi:hypothetical protein